MFFILSKIFDFFLSPVLWILVFIVIALLIRNAKKSRRWIIAALCVFIFFSNSFIADQFLRLTETPVNPDSLLKQYDAGIILGGGMVTVDKPKNRLIFRQNTDRLLQAIHLYKKGVVKKLLISGGSGSIIFRDVLESALVRKYLIETGIPEDDILTDSLSNNTYENAVKSAEILKERFPGGRFLLITSALHMPRARACFIKQGIETDVFPTDKISSEVRRWDLNFLLVPDTGNFAVWEKLFHEWIGYIVYYFAGYL